MNISLRFKYLAVIVAIQAMPSLAIDADLDVDGKPEQACLATEKTMRMILNIWANQATDTYGQVRDDLKTGLREHGERGLKLIPVYETMMGRIESGEFLPPKVISRYVGHQNLRAATHGACMKAIAE
jgi:hypothetical protein